VRKKVYRMGLVIFKGDTKIGVYNFPNVKRPRLCVEKGNSVTAYATFRNEECAEMFMNELIDMFGLKKEP
jgi:hypothetical protein